MAVGAARFQCGSRSRSSTCSLGSGPNCGACWHSSRFSSTWSFWGAFAVVGFVLPTHRVLPTRYYHIGHPERLSSIYRALRVDLFGRALLATLWRDHAQRRRYFDGSPSGLAHLDVQSRSAEFGHVVPFVLVTFASIRWALGGAFGLAGFAFAFNVLINMYPVLLQRHHRMRVQRLQGLRRARVGRP